MIGDIIGNIITGKIKNGISNMFGGSSGGGSKKDYEDYAPTFSNLEVGIETSTPPGEAESVNASDPETNLALWQRRLFQGENAYAIKVAGRIE